MLVTLSISASDGRHLEVEVEGEFLIDPTIPGWRARLVESALIQARAAARCLEGQLPDEPSMQITQSSPNDSFLPLAAVLRKYSEVPLGSRFVGLA